LLGKYREPRAVARFSLLGKDPKVKTSYEKPSTRWGGRPAINRRSLDQATSAYNRPKKMILHRAPFRGPVARPAPYAALTACLDSPRTLAQIYLSASGRRRVARQVLHQYLSTLMVSHQTALTFVAEVDHGKR